MNSNLRLLIEQAKFATPRSEKERLIFQWLPLIDHVAQKLAIEWLTDEQLTVGLDALMHAAELFDPTRGVQFQTYAYTTIWRALARDRQGKKRRIVCLPLLLEGRDGQPRERHECSYEPQDLVVAREERRRSRRRARAALARMRPRDRQIVLAVIGGQSRVQVGRRLGLGKERARQLFDRGIREARATARLAAEAVA